MSTALTPYQHASLVERQTYAQTLALGGDLIPKGLWAPVRKEDGTMGPPVPSPGKVLLVMETGAMLGIHPMAALQGIHVIEGKAAISPALMSAVVRKAGHTLRVTTSGSMAAGDFAATASLTRSDDPDFTYEAVWTMERATRAKLQAKDNWVKYPEAMCKARAISEVCREGAEDVLMGVHYTPDELGELVAETGDAIESEPEPSEDWAAAIDAADSKDAVTEVVNRAKESGEFTDKVRTLALTRYGMLRRADEQPAQEPIPEESPAEPDENIEDDVEVADDDSPLTPGLQPLDTEMSEEEWERQSAAEFDRAQKAKARP